MEFRNPIPNGVRKAVYKRSGRCCEECGSKPIELHHLTYDAHHGNHWPDTQPIFGLETPDDLKALCRICHLAKHRGPNGEFFRDPEECAAEWDYYRHVSDND